MILSPDNFDVACMVDEVGYFSGPLRHVFFVRVVMMHVKEGVMLTDRFNVDVSVHAHATEFRWSMLNTVQRICQGRSDMEMIE